MRLCSYYGISRQAFYQHFKREIRKKRQEEWLVAVIHKIRNKLPQIGGNNLWKLVRRIFHALGLKPIGRDRLAMILKQFGLQVWRRKRRRVRTTYSNHRYVVQPNLLHGVEAKKPGEVLVADITHIALTGEAAFLFLITDAFSRMIVGYHLSRNLAHEGAVKALNSALEHIPNPKGIIHHSDRGIQYCSHSFLDEIRLWGMKSSMTDADHCAQNALAECMNGILKSEFLLDRRFPSFYQAELAVKDAVFAYNHLRVHGSLDGKTPAEVQYGYDGSIDLWAKELVSYSLPIPNDLRYV